ncbi:MAG: SDR family NAD(P)-dependent oxidoreductase [Acholeplasmataceae bacterium]|nr:SDR family NAD(P)-dependent oxidoreductase [Acholeplasmataceae bacterium]
MKKTKWSVSNIESLKGKVMIVTGGNSGLGYESAKVFVKNHATVILACRSLERAEEAKKKILSDYPKGHVSVMQLDLESLDSVKSFTKTFYDKYKKLDVLLNNAGIMTVPYGLTHDGFERQNGVNHLGHFALTAQLFKLLKSTPNSRIVNVSSIAHKMGKMDFDNYLFQNGSYGKFKSYGRSKLSNLLFTYELDRKIKEEALDIKVVAAHPGIANTKLSRSIKQNWFTKPLISLFFKLSQQADEGALPEIRACVDPDVLSGEFYGPKGIIFTKKHPGIVKSNKASHSLEDAKKLWSISEELTHQKFEL